MKSKTIIIIISVILLLAICTGATVIIINKVKENKNNNQDTGENVQEENTSKPENEDENVYIPPEEESDEEIEARHNLTLKIISPEEEIFSERQARYYNALAEGNAKYSNLIKCHWDFYLDQNNGEALYQTMDNGGVLSGESKEVCGFTSTFIEASGNLRVVLTMTVYDAVNDNLETVTAERKYVVR